MIGNAGRAIKRASGFSAAFRMGTVAAALSAIGAMVWSGCGSNNERYYCDDTGCFQCDGYGCGTVTPPPSKSCTGAAGCPAGQVCTDQGLCQATCAATTDCAKGTVCKGGLCVAPAVTDAGTPKECTTTTDCTGGKVCIANHCQACGGTNGPCPCAANTDCANGQQCVAGACTDPKNICKYNSDCEAGKICENGQCVAGCTDTCAPPATCVKGGCVTPPGNTCQLDSQCPTTAPKCVGGNCVPACTTDSQCATGNYCNQGACVPDTRPKTNCNGDADCAGSGAPQACVGGYCRYKCVGDKDCQIIDARIGFCAADLVCRTQTEAHPQCTTKSQCASGQDCISNVCR